MGYSVFLSNLVASGAFFARKFEPDAYVHDLHNADRTVLMERVEGDHREPWTWVRKHGKGRVFYTYQDEYTCTAVGQGAIHSGAKIKIWSGTNVLEYLRGDTGERIAYLPCDGGSILMG